MQSQTEARQWTIVFNWICFVVYYSILIYCLTVRLTDTFNFILLLDGIAIGRSTRGVDEFLREALGHGLQVAETGFPRAGGQQVQGVVDTAKGGHIDGLATDHTGSTDTRRIFARTRVDNGVHHDLHRVLVREQVNDFERVLNDAHGHQFLARVAALLHETASEALDDRAGSLAETLLGVSSSRVRQIGGVVTLAGNVILCSSSQIENVQDCMAR